jgi:Lar family restriction alleviation protein
MPDKLKPCQTPGKLEPCPFCGSVENLSADTTEGSLYYLTEDRAHQYFQIVCGGCGASSGLREGTKKVRKHWNHRTPERDSGKKG